MVQPYLFGSDVDGPASVDHRHIDAQQADGSRAVRDRAVRPCRACSDRNVTFGNQSASPMAPEMLIMDSTSEEYPGLPL